MSSFSSNIQDESFDIERYQQLSDQQTLDDVIQCEFEISQSDSQLAPGVKLHQEISFDRSLLMQNPAGSHESSSAHAVRGERSFCAKSYITDSQRDLNTEPNVNLTSPHARILHKNSATLPENEAHCVVPNRDLDIGKKVTLCGASSEGDSSRGVDIEDLLDEGSIPDITDFIQEGQVVTDSEQLTFFTTDNETTENESVAGRKVIQQPDLQQQFSKELIQVTRDIEVDFGQITEALHDVVENMIEKSVFAGADRIPEQVKAELVQQYTVSLLAEQAAISQAIEGQTLAADAQIRAYELLCQQFAENNSKLCNKLSQFNKGYYISNQKEMAKASFPQYAKKQGVVVVPQYAKKQSATITFQKQQSVSNQHPKAKYAMKTNVK
ncbi:hypothetical protein SS50377_22870 [Spironucleus salmonicida]|uniref:Uncharacterized protein n=1 Tax=Spironucleus salmonicida TaxID=348837 RepID=V6LVR9_9EUKA|nr:hypothetical protein SS50377_22870 [Spironucleus salmonicida]|eukprot:EST48722.1 Hypothetical protein SS50377_11038 [Spironucleus salmonicida]